jgi:RNA polymerase sigma-70 factor (ECF subfamily)
MDPRMHTTSVTLLEKVRCPADQQAWARFVELYTPLLYFWACGVRLPSHEAADLVQEVLTTLVRKLPDFRYDAGKSFRGWLRTLTYNKWREIRRRHASVPETVEGDLEDVPAPAESDPFEEEKYRRHLISRALKLMQTEFEPPIWRACWECVVAGKPAAQVAAELGTTRDAVYAAKSRVLRRLREELEGLLD